MGLSFALSDRLTHAVNPMVPHPLFPRALSFKTFPDPRLSHSSTHFTFAVSSCLKPQFPFSPFRSPTAIPGAVKLAQTARQHSIDFFVFLGDFIYSDVPGRIFSKPKTPEAFRRFYRQLYASADLRKIYESIRESFPRH
jgi:alkaline phosphatase D